MKITARLTRNLKEAIADKEGVLAWYQKEIDELKKELRKSKNAFRAQCIMQDLELLQYEHGVVSNGWVEC